MSFLVRAIILGLFITLPASVQAADEGSVKLQHPWVREAPKASPVAGGYVTIVNEGATADRLVEVTSPAASRVEVHEVIMAKGVASMRAVERLRIPARQSVVLKPGGLHLMFFEPKPFTKGQPVPVTLTFERGGPVTAEFVVEELAVREPGHDSHVRRP